MTDHYWTFNCISPIELWGGLEGDFRWSLSEDSQDEEPLPNNRAMAVNGLDAPPKTKFRLRQNTDTFKVPVEINVGSGAAAKRVNLAKFEPLGRIDFNLDGVDLSNAINQYLDQTEQPRPPEGEQLLNHELQFELEMPTFTLLGWEQIGPHLTPAGAPLESIHIGNGESAASGISQTVATLAGIDYQLSVLASIRIRDAKAELIWRADDCAVVKVDELTLEAMPSEATLSTLEVVSEIPAHRLYRLRATAPEGSNQVEVRLLIPENGAAHVDRVSLVASPQKLANHDLQEYDHQTIPGWAVEPTDALTNKMLHVGYRLEGREISNMSDDLQPIILAQTISVSAAQIINVGFSGRNMTDSTDHDAVSDPEILLRLINQASGDLMLEMQRVITQASSDQHSLNTVVPDGADQAEIAIVLPQGRRLAVQALTLELSDAQQVPVTFLSEAPGELTLRDLRVGYEPKPAPQLPVPENRVLRSDGRRSNRWR